ncbi:hypothetical protein RB195_022287 [Necator americanus]|uniref:Uncharacterized protein n=1 Tax=Necator americanus TaxID=51031 RepID=A0ABR1EFC9_NECAM
MTDSLNTFTTARKRLSFKTTKRRLSPETLKPVEQYEPHRTKNSRPCSQGFAERRQRKTLKREEQKYWLKLQRRGKAFAIPIETSPVTIQG